MPDLIYSLFGKRIKRKLAALEYRPKDFDGMKYAFPGIDGKAYYTWSGVDELPAVRTKQLEDYMLWLDAHTTRKSLESFDEDLTKGLSSIVKIKEEEKRWKAATNLSALYKEVLLRGMRIIPEELYYQIAALTIAREDENPHGFDAAIQDQKAEMLHNAGQAGYSAFFLHMPTFRSLLKAWLTSEEGYRELLTNWMLMRDRVLHAREVLSSFSKS